MESEIGLAAIALRLILACFLGGVIGIEREFTNSYSNLVSGGPIYDNGD